METPWEKRWIRVYFDCCCYCTIIARNYHWPRRKWMSPKRTPLSSHLNCWLHSARAKQSIDGNKHVAVMRIPADYLNSFQMVRLSTLIDWPQAAVPRPGQVQNVRPHLRTLANWRYAKEPPARIDILFAVKLNWSNLIHLVFFFVVPSTGCVGALDRMLFLRSLIATFHHLRSISASRCVASAARPCICPH